MSDNKLIILNETFGKEGSDEKVEGLTLIVDGQIKTAFDAIKTRKNYSNYNEVLRKYFERKIVNNDEYERIKLVLSFFCSFELHI